MNSEHSNLLLDLAKFVVQQPSPIELREKAFEAKCRLSAVVDELWKGIALIDSFVANFAPDPTWKIGYLDLAGRASTQIEKATASPQARIATPTPTPSAKLTSQPARVLEIANGLIASGETMVTSKAIAERRKGEGDQRSLRELAISAGNVLARSRTWRKVRPGIYVPWKEGEKLKVS